MGQYWKLVNLDKREYVLPHKLGCGMKLWEQLANHPSTGSALLILCAAMPEARGGGDFDLDQNWSGPERTMPKYAGSPGPMPEEYPAIAHRTIGRWAGDRIALIGDYAEPGDLAPEHHAEEIYDLCITEEDRKERVLNWLHRADDMHSGKESPSDYGGHDASYYEAKAHELKAAKLYLDISDDVCAVIEHELHGKFTGDGWREFKHDKEA